MKTNFLNYWIAFYLFLFSPPYIKATDVSLKRIKLFPKCTEFTAWSLYIRYVQRTLTKHTTQHNVHRKNGENRKNHGWFSFSVGPLLIAASPSFIFPKSCAIKVKSKSWKTLLGCLYSFCTQDWSLSSPAIFSSNAILIRASFSDPAVKSIHSFLKHFFINPTKQ